MDGLQREIDEELKCRFTESKQVRENKEKERRVSKSRTRSNRKNGSEMTLLRVLLMVNDEITV